MIIYTALSFLIFQCFLFQVVQCTLKENQNQTLCDDEAKNLLVKTVLPSLKLVGYLFIIWDGNCAFELSRIFVTNSVQCCITCVSFDINTINIYYIMDQLKNIPNTPPFLKLTTVIWLLSWKRTLEMFSLIQNNVTLHTVTQQRYSHLIFSVYNDFLIPPNELVKYFSEGMAVYVVIINEDKVHLYTVKYSPNGPQLTKINNRRRVIIEAFSKSLNLDGRELLICSIPEYPFSSVTTHPNGTVTWENGFDMKLITLLENHFNFRAKMVYPDEVQIDGKNLTRNWHNVIRALQYRKVHLGIAELVITLTRFERVDFGTHYFSEPLVIVTKEPGFLPRTFIFFLPFQSMIWVMIVLSFVVFAFIFLMAITISQRFLIPVYNIKKFRLNLKTYFNFLWLTFANFFRGNPLNVPPITSQRLLVIFWGFFSFILIAVYQGSLTSHLTIPIQNEPINNLRMLSRKMDTSSITWNAMPGSSHQDRFTQAKNGIYKELNDKRLAKKTIIPKNNAHDNIEMTLKENLAFFTGKTVATFETAKFGKNKFHIGKEGFFTQQYSIAFQRGSPYKRQFDKVVSKIVECGIATHWLNEFINELGVENFNSKHTEDKVKSIQLEDLQGAFFILFSGYFITTISLIIELISRKIRKRRITV